MVLSRCWSGLTEGFRMDALTAARHRDLAEDYLITHPRDAAVDRVRELVQAWVTDYGVPALIVAPPLPETPLPKLATSASSYTGGGDHRSGR
jgi:hypothetical protein